MEKVRAGQIILKALKTRRTYLGVEAHLPICPYTLCEAMGFDLRFVKISSFEGMYIAKQNRVFISSSRPEGRKRFTCAHEIGHHVLGHGTVIDEILECGSNKQEEQEADFFASMLLMPSSSIKRIIQRYGVAIEDMTEIDAYKISKYFGVSYQAFITHIRINLGFITYNHYQSLRNARLQDIRFAISGLNTKNQVFSIGAWWDEKAIELEVGDLIISDTELFIDGPQILQPVDNVDKYIYEAKSTGISRIFNDDWSCFIKVCRYKFQGMYQYKFEEEDE